jgi:hypothetical protein
MSSFRQIYPDTLSEAARFLLERDSDRPDLSRLVIAAASSQTPPAKLSPSDVVALAWMIELCEFMAVSDSVAIEGPLGQLLRHLLAVPAWMATLLTGQEAQATRFDNVLSVGVISRYQAKQRSEEIGRLRRLTHPGGRLLLAVDVMKSSDFIWNEWQGSEVESPILHGTIADLEGELRDAGFHCISRSLRRNLPEGRCDVLLVALRNKGDY